MVAHITTVAFMGLEARPVDVQVQVAGGMPSFAIVGLPDKAVNEAKERVRAALTAVGLALPPKRITVNLSPADLPKEGSHYDLPIALGLLVAMEVLPREDMAELVALGELSLDGRLTPVPGVLPAAMAAVALDKGLVCPGPQGGEAAWAGALSVLAAPDLAALIGHFKGSQILPQPAPQLLDATERQPDLKDIKGQETAKRALEVAAAGGHNLLFVGPPGAGKSMLAARLPGLLPPLDAAEALDVSMIRSISGLLDDGRIGRTRPFRAPHHSASMPALIGGGTRARPGEVSLAHKGVLFLDELPEFSRPALEALRQPLESGRAVIARAAAHVSYPARFQLIAAMNPCRCGHLDDPGLACSRAPRCAADYQSRISGPLFDRIDLHVDVAALTAADLTRPAPAEGSAEVAARVADARARQARRYADLGFATNAEADGDVLARVAALDAAGTALLEQAVERLRLSARGYHRVLRVARTLADLAGAQALGRAHVAEALAYRRLQPGLSLA
ncbi:magnesium chelatase family protein [Rhodothalassium salexigens DSM 2132]|uniref:Magnesium chelatase family protein n=1 Tax=Rhodothalassium salexigens DSM 2132 TaxID=1188247 RepID=A0A4R2PN99_RHOSA|nr:YifB family Mg chelatase-like AAA ATPase [Rhodothalassium salexigens]MBB4211106.1 magnesium chelatase family protein [Rhodothalassium salexigens DSM 2132]MBK1637448.1 AAA family ATPase [Rhodothalassium salexigens DSM 2132]TCP36238.1 magnesium chelatase family protein [Rhodothalassium salexigens DSM 2132]